MPLAPAKYLYMMYNVHHECQLKFTKCNFFVIFRKVIFPYLKTVLTRW